MQHLFQLWVSFTSAVSASAHVLLLADYDGTLTPIVGRPEEAVLSSGIKTKLLSLSEKPAFSVGIISGRALSEVKSLVGIEGIYYAGNHGLEIEGPGLQFIHPATEAARSEIATLVRQLSARLGDIEGVVIENKGLSLSIHYRLVKEGMEPIVAKLFQQITSPRLNAGKIRVTTGKKVLEVRPPIDWDKGKALETIRKRIEELLGLEQLLTVYLGDDATDEDAFRIIQHTEGWGIFIGQENPTSNAEYFLNSTSEVETFLSELLNLK